MFVLAVNKESRKRFYGNSKMPIRPLPKRTKDLPPLEPDSEDEMKTPAKMPEILEENEDEIPEVNQNGPRTSIPQPKRLSELPSLESYSDEEGEGMNTENEILNNSFILSPSESMDYLPTISSSAETRGQTKTIIDLNKKTVDKDLDISLGIKKLDVSDEDNKETCCKKTLMPLFSQKENIDFNNISNNSAKNASIELSDAKSNPFYSTSLCRTNSLNLNVDTIKASVITRTKSADEASMKICEAKNMQKINKRELDLETPLKVDNFDFVTPQIKSFQVPASRRFRQITSSTSQRTRTAIENEFRSQKVLFTTPVSLTRPPILTLPDDSLTLSLLESLGKKDTKTNLTENKFSKGLSDSLVSDELKNENISVINGKCFIIGQKLGSGGSSSVFAAKEVDRDKEWALKIVDLHGDKSIVEGYLNEVKLLAKLQGNINVVALYQYEHIEKESKLYMVMEKGDSDLHKILQTYQHYLPLYTLMNFWYQMLQSVNYIHENGVIHSDLKPANFLMVNGRLKLIDFGIASNIAIDSTSIIKFSQAGTFNYISPEALIDTSTGYSPAPKGQPKIKISKKSDVWSLGCILYLLLYKKTPFGHIKQINAKVNAITNPSTKIEYPKLPFYYPPMLIEMADKCLRHNPKQRASVMDLLKYPFDMVIPIDNAGFAKQN